MISAGKRWIVAAVLCLLQMSPTVVMAQLLPDTFVIKPEGPTMAEILNRNNPRRTVSLDGQWEFKIDGEIHWRTARVPGAWQSDYPDLKNYSGSVEFRRSITIPVTFKDDAWLVIGAADYAVRVSVNGRYAGNAESGYLPFAVNLAPFGKASETVQVSITVDDPTKEKPLKSYPYAETPQGLQHKFGYVGGLWQSVWLEERPPTFVKAAKVTPDVAGSAINVEVQLNDTPPNAEGTLYATVYSGKTNAPIAQFKSDLSSQTVYRFRSLISNARLWSQDSPDLYTLNVSVETDGGTRVDQYQTRFGMRKLEAKNGRLYLNGDPFYIRGAYDYGYYPETLYTPPSEGFIRNHFEKARQLGFNLIRIRSKIPDPLYVRIADETGMLLWYDLPAIEALTANSRKRIARLLEGVTERDYNSPSFVVLSVVNDSSGIDLANSDHIKWLGSAYDFAKKLLPDRLIIDNSTSDVSVQVKADILDVIAANDNSDLDGLVTQSEASQQHPVVISGIGHWGLPLTTALSECYQSGIPFWWNDGQGYLNAYNVEQRFRQMNLGSLFGEYSRFARTTQEMQLDRLKSAIERARANPRLSGYILDQLADTYYKSNGVLDVCRNLKVSSRMMGLVQQNAVIVAEPSDSADGVAAIRLTGSNFGPVVPSGSKVSWALEGFPEIKGVLLIDRDVLQGVSDIGLINVELPQVTTTRDTRVLIRWTSGDQVVAQNYLDTDLWPGPGKNLNPIAYYISDTLPGSSQLKDWLLAEGGRLADNIVSADLVITDQIAGEVTSFVQEGGRALLQVTKAQTALPEGLGVQAIDPGLLPANAAFNWMDGNVFPTAIPTRGQLFSWGVTGMEPDYVISGISADVWKQVDAGRFYGWLHDTAAYTIRLNQGNGRVIATTIPLAQSIFTSPVAQKLLYRYIDQLTGQEFISTASLP